jgi:hypothetical protein
MTSDQKETSVIALAVEELAHRAPDERAQVRPTDENVSGNEETMATAEERLAILRMIEQGKISAEEGARLLAALGGRKPPGAAAGAPPSVLNTSRALHIRVTDLLNNQTKVNVSLPVGLVWFGLRFVPKSAGIDVAQIQQAVESGSVGRILEVVDHEDGTRVEITLE